MYLFQFSTRSGDGESGSSSRSWDQILCFLGWYLARIFEVELVPVLQFRRPNASASTASDTPNLACNDSIFGGRTRGSAWPWKYRESRSGRTARKVRREKGHLVSHPTWESDAINGFAGQLATIYGVVASWWGSGGSSVVGGQVVGRRG